MFLGFVSSDNLELIHKNEYFIFNFPTNNVFVTLIPILKSLFVVNLISSLILFKRSKEKYYDITRFFVFSVLLTNPLFLFTNHKYVLTMIIINMLLISMFYICYIVLDTLHIDYKLGLIMFIIFLLLLVSSSILIFIDYNLVNHLEWILAITFSALIFFLALFTKNYITLLCLSVGLLIKIISYVLLNIQNLSVDRFFIQFPDFYFYDIVLISMIGFFFTFNQSQVKVLRSINDIIAGLAYSIVAAVISVYFLVSLDRSHAFVIFMLPILFVFVTVFDYFLFLYSSVLYLLDDK